MQIHRKASLRRAAFALSFAVVGAARAAEPTQQELLERINALQAQVEELKAARPQTPAQAASRQTDAAINAAVQDAERRSQLLAGDAFTTSYTNGKLEFRSGDTFLLHPWAQFQVREVSTYRDGAKHGGADDDFQSGFEIRRLKVGFDGYVFTPDLTYNFNWAVDRKTGQPIQENAFVQYHLPDTKFAVRAGQFKNPLDHEQLSSTKYTAAVERTLIDDLFAGGEGYVQGVDFIFDNGRNVRADVAIHDGMRSGNTSFRDFPTAGIPANWGVSGRAEYKLFGRWADYDKLANYGIKEDVLVFGTGADYTEAGDTVTVTHVLDTQYGMKDGLGAYAAYLGRYIKDNAAGGGTDTYDWTFRAQLSYVIDKKWEPFLQYEFIRFDPATQAAATENEVHVIRIGTSYFLYGQNARIQVDFSYLPNGSPIDDDGLGILQTNGKNQFILRAQFQLLL